MFKKYRFLIFFCFLVMLTGVMFLSINDEIQKVNNIEDTTHNDQEADAATVSVGFTITNVYGTQNNSDLGATFNYKLNALNSGHFLLPIIKAQLVKIN